MNLPRAVILRLWPPLPAAVRDAYAISQYDRLTRQMPMLHLALMLIVLATLATLNPDAPDMVRLGIPAFVLLASIARLLIWRGRPDCSPNADLARRRIAGMTLFSSLVAVAASLWCVVSWFGAPHATAIYFPMLLVLGEFATVLSMIPIRSAAYANLIIGTGPITLVLATFGDSFERVMALAIGTTATFLVGMLRNQHGDVIERLLLEQKMTGLAETDALTGIANRRGLEREFARLVNGSADAAGGALILIDLDEFKPINDRHGHEVGDAVLIKVAARLRGAVCSDGMVCRLGGDEFAVLLHPNGLRQPERIAGSILAALGKPVMVAGNPLSIRASLGIAERSGNGTVLAELLASADAAMYRAKRGQGNILPLASPRAKRMRDRITPIAAKIA